MRSVMTYVTLYVSPIWIFQVKSFWRIKPYWTLNFLMFSSVKIGQGLFNCREEGKYFNESFVVIELWKCKLLNQPVLTSRFAGSR